MYWIFFALFLVAVFIPDIIRGDVSFLVEERAEEATIFLIGALAFFIFIAKEKELFFEREEKERHKKRLDQTGKDLVESYSYIGEVNRKIDMLMGVALGIHKSPALDKEEEEESYALIADAAKLLLRGDCCLLRFVNLETKKTEKEVEIREKGSRSCARIANDEIVDFRKNVFVKKKKDYILICSSNKVDKVRSFLLISGYSAEEEEKPKNMEILKVFASQALFVFSLAARKKNES